VPDAIQKLEREFGQAILKNDADAIRRFLAEDWVIIGPDGGQSTDRVSLTWSETGRWATKQWTRMTLEFGSMGMPRP
jgi:ketosteroid isomerase-like protein